MTGDLEAQHGDAERPDDAPGDRDQLTVRVGEAEPVARAGYGAFAITGAPPSADPEGVLRRVPVSGGGRAGRGRLSHARVPAYRDAMEGAGRAVVGEVVEYLCDGVSVTVVGVRGSGRSQISRLAADRLREQGFSVVLVAGVAALRDRPLAALAVAGVNTHPAVNAHSISGAVDALRQMTAARRSVLVIDDADDLDAVTAGAIVALHSQRPVPVLSVTRPAARRQQLTRLFTAELQPGVRVALEPLRFDEMHAIVHQLLPGPVDSSTMVEIATLSGGLPGLVRAIVDTDRRAGRIAEVDGIWRANGDLWTDRLSQVVEPLLVDLADEDLDALMQLAEAGGIDAAAARQMVGTPTLVRLSQQELVRAVGSPSGPFVSVVPPLVAEYLRRAGVVSSWLRDGGDGLSDDARSGGESAAAGHRAALSSSDATLLNRRISEHWQAEVEVLRQAWLASPDAAHALRLVMAMHAATARASDIDLVIKQTDPRGSASQDRASFVSWQAAYRAAGSHDFATAVALLESAAAELPEHANQLHATEAQMSILEGKMPDAALLTPVPGDSVGVQGIEAVRLEILVAQGMTRDAEARLEGFAPTYSRHAMIGVALLVGLNRVLAGDLSGGIDWAFEQLAAARQSFVPGAVQAHAYVAALGLALAGRLDELDELLAAVLPLTGATTLREQYQVGLLTLAARAAGWRGRDDYARSLAVQARALAHPPGPFPAMLPDVTPIFVEQRARTSSEAGEDLWGQADERLGAGFAVAGIFCAVTAVEVLPDPARAAVAIRTAEATQSEFLQALGRYVDATARRDAEALARCVAEFRALRAMLFAVKAGVSRAIVLRQAGQIAEAVEQARATWEDALPLGPERAGLFVPLARVFDLSGRERQVAEMLVEGQSPLEVASALGLSVRTVENHLFNAYRKLGVDGRDQMVQAVSTWAVLL